MVKELESKFDSNVKWAIIATWKFGLSAVKTGSEILNSGGSALDCVEDSIKVVDLDTSVNSVGLGGLPNEKGEVELDGGIMDGSTLNLGAVSSIKRHAHPASIGRKIMENLPHTFLTGEDADRFAGECGFESINLLTDEAKTKWEEWKESGSPGDSLENSSGYDSCNKLPNNSSNNSGIHSHDTVGVVALDGAGHICAGTSTSGLKFKRAGRVGDSPLVGSGFYADDEGGGATATGHGEHIMKGCLSFYTVELMKTGMHPQEAVNKAINRFVRRTGLKAKDNAGDIALIAIDKYGRWGGAANHNKFSFAIFTSEMNEAKLVNCSAL